MVHQWPQCSPALLSSSLQQVTPDGSNVSDAEEQEERLGMEPMMTKVSSNKAEESLTIRVAWQHNRSTRSTTSFSNQQFTILSQFESPQK